mmetsp:Transcript_32629/g.39497  ORF Transcript_32629/g.39497 Transcript_32629/m.39497 type:complete len:196 (-) Transcript_32629:15-602(-)|eukprot:CAMPEP_0197852632 /NCGR_PEP_ID=MMETSP1438-20131217/21111_1 /TAXON_ID=1461541 /ORGANISM="Pterosperma sp., Strain CCMP1384" /LENGTH=195 /DNA_ID=CAMNT_0043466783 /DNA_START=128 /DNA_END=715 /DNA_ORIENTATION=+
MSRDQDSSTSLYAPSSAYSLLSEVTQDRLMKLNKTQLIQVIGDLLAMAAQTEKERAQRFDVALVDLLEKQKRQKKQEKDRAARKLQKEKDWLMERRVSLGTMAKLCEREQAAVTVQREFRAFQEKQKQMLEDKKARLKWMSRDPVFKSQLAESSVRLKACLTIQQEWRRHYQRVNHIKFKNLKELEAARRALENM